MALVFTRFDEPLVTGYHGLDSLCGGIRRGALTVVTSLPTVGRTTFCLSLLSRLSLDRKVPSLFISSELSDRETTLRLYMMETGMTAQQFMGVDFDALEKKVEDAYSEEERELVAHLDKVETAPYDYMDYFDLIPNGGPHGEASLGEQIEVYAKSHKLELVLIDGYRLLTNDHFESGIELDRLSFNLQDLLNVAKEFGYAIVVTWPLLWDRYVASRYYVPCLVDMSYHRLFENFADVIIALHRDFEGRDEERFPGETDLFVLKNNMGATGKTRLVFDSWLAQFNDYFDGCEVSVPADNNAE